MLLSEPCSLSVTRARTTPHHWPHSVSTKHDIVETSQEKKLYFVWVIAITCIGTLSSDSVPIFGGGGGERACWHYSYIW